MNSELVRNYRVERKFSEYASFFDHDWATNITDIAAGTAFESAVFDLCETWKSAANAARLAWWSVRSMYLFAEGQCRTPPLSKKTTLALGQMLAASVHPPLTPEQGKSLLNALSDSHSKLEEAAGKAPVPFSEDEAWESMLEHPEFSLGVIASQRMTFATIYAGYEEFIVLCARQALKDNGLRATNQFRATLAAAYGNPNADRWWNDEDVEVARLLRHAVMHKGGRVTNELSRITHRYDVLDGAVQITPGVNQFIYDELKVRAVECLQASLNRV